MMTRSVPGVGVSLGFVVPVAISLAGILLFLGRLAIKAHRQLPTTGIEGLIGQLGRARTALSPEADGQIDVRGEIWRARSDVTLGPGDTVRVTAVHGLTLSVEPPRDSPLDARQIGAATRQGAK
jgi:membrane-bound serine protease (ClpP class)